MKLMVQPYNSGASAYNAEQEETAALHYAPTHGFDNPAEVTITLSDPIGLIAQRYAASNGAVGGAVADDGGAETDETTEANEDTADDMTLLPAAPELSDAYYFGLSHPFSAVQLDVSTVADVVGLYVITWEYSTGSDAWTALSGVTDGTNKYQNAGVNTIDWTIPNDWATDEVGGISGLYWVRGRLTDNAAWNTVPIGQQAWIEGTYLGVGKVTIEDPDGTDMFYGRIMRAEADTAARKLTLYCQDWLSQLDEVQITYDMREDLDSDDDTGKQGLRESTLHADPDNATIVDVAYNDGGGPDKYYLYDDDRSWNADEFNAIAMFVILVNGMAGKKTWRFFPYQATATDADVYGDDPHVLWEDDDAVDVGFADNDWTLDYDFRIYLGHDDPSDFYRHSSITGIRVGVVYQVGGGANNHSHIQVDDKTDGYFEFQTLEEDDHFIRAVYELNADEYTKVIDSDGIATVRFDIDRAGGNATLSLKFLYIEVDVETTGYSSAISIADTLDLNGHGGKVNCLEVGTDMTAAATRVWEAVPYCIAKPIFKHIESATGIVLGGDTMVTLTCGDANVEDTSGISTRQYIGKTRLQIWKDVARQDKAHFWLALGTVIVTYKSTFNDGSPETLTDTDMNSITSILDYSTLANEVTAYGMRIGDNRLSSIYTDAVSEAKYNQTRTKITSDTGLVSEHDTLARATALVNQYKDVQQILTCTIRGNTAKASHDKTLVLGDEVSITSAYLGLSSAVYIVQRWSYDSNPNVNLTTLLLHPRVSQVGLQRDERPSFEMVMQDNRRGTADRYVPAPESNEVA